MQIFSSYAQTYLQVPINNLETNIRVANTTGGLFTNPTGYEYELLVLTDGDLWEVVRMEGRVADDLTVVRGFEGVARPWEAGTIVKNSVTKKTLENLLQDDSVGAAIRLYAYHNFR